MDRAAWRDYFILVVVLYILQCSQIVTLKAITMMSIECRDFNVIFLFSQNFTMILWIFYCDFLAALLTGKRCQQKPVPKIHDTLTSFRHQLATTVNQSFINFIR